MRKTPKTVQCRVCDDADRWKTLPSVFTSAQSTAKMTAALPQCGARVQWSCVRRDIHLQLELTSCASPELVSVSERRRMTTLNSLCEHLGNNHRILRTGWVTSHRCVSSGISSLLYHLPRVIPTVSISWSNHNSHVPVPKPPTHHHSVLLPPQWSGIHRCRWMEMFSSMLQTSATAEPHASSQCAFTAPGRPPSQSSTAKFLLIKYSCLPGEIFASARLCKRLQAAKRSFGSLFALNHLKVPGFHFWQCYYTDLP